MSESPQRIETHHLKRCPGCQEDLSEVESRTYQKRQVYDIPPVQIEVTEHRAEIKVCPHCQKRVRADFPAGVEQAVQYGEWIKAQACYLNSYQLLPMERSCEVLGDFYGHQPAVALIQEANEAVATQTQPVIEAIEQQLSQAPLTHHDESGLRVADKTEWVHVSSTEQLTHYGLDEKRGQLGMQAIGILPTLTGRIVHDHWQAYLGFEQLQHAFCNAHHLRELTFISQQYQQPWANDMRCLLLDVKDAVASASQTADSLSPSQLADFSRRYDQILHAGFESYPPPDPPPTKKRGRLKQSPPKNLLDRFLKHKDQVLAFMFDFRVPFDNNLAERDLRMIKVKQKVSGSFRTHEGAKTFCTIRSYLSTVRKQGLRVMASIRNAIAGHPDFPAIQTIT